MPTGNVGLHNAYSVEKHNSEGRVLLKGPLYRPKKTNDKFELYINKLTERIVYVRNIHIQHWAFKEIRSKFKVNCLNKWEAHPINITNIAILAKNYTILAECSKGPIIIEHNNALAVQFSIDPNYSETVQILKNFLRRNLTNQPKQIISSSYKNSACDKVRTPQLHDDSFKLYTEKFFHSGWSYSKRHGIYITKNNAISDTPLKISVLYGKKSRTENVSPRLTINKYKQYTKSILKKEVHHNSINKRNNSWDKKGIRSSLRTRASNHCKIGLARKELFNVKYTSGHSSVNPYNEFSRNNFSRRYKVSTTNKKDRHSMETTYGFIS